MATTNSRAPTHTSRRKNASRPERNARHRTATHGGRDRKRAGNGASPKSEHDRYVELAAAAAASGDIVGSEYYYQHAEHYFRILNPLSETPEN